jgi:hypothetical protein
VIGWLVFAVTFAVYAWTASPSLGWLDSPEFVAASAELGVAHSPGHPVPALLGKLCALLPFGDLPFRVNLASALLGAVAALALTAAAEQALRSTAPRLGAHARAALAAAAGLIYAFSWAAWTQSVRAEVYALQAALLAAATGAVLAYTRDRGRDPRPLYLAGLFTGLGLANHHFMAVCFFLPAAALVCAQPPLLRWRRAGITAALGLLALACFLYLPVRSATGPVVNWGAPHNLARFLWTVSARAFQNAPLREPVSTGGEEISLVTEAIVDAVSLPLALLAVLAVYLLLRRPGFRGEAIFLAAVTVISAGARVLIGFDPETPDHYAYLLPGIATLTVLAVAGVGGLLSWLTEQKRVPGLTSCVVGALLLLVPFQLAENWQAANLAGGYAADEYARWQLDRVPPRSLLLLAYFQTSFRLAALEVVEAARPDLAVLDRSLLTYPGGAEQAVRRHPDLAALVAAPLRAGSPTPLTMLRDLALKRPLLIELHPNLDADANQFLLPNGPFALFVPSPPEPAQRDYAESSDAAERASLEALLLSEANAPETRASGDRRSAELALLWHDFLRVRFYCAVGRKNAARQAYSAARARFPDDSMLQASAMECGLPEETTAPP